MLPTTRTFFLYAYYSKIRVSLCCKVLVLLDGFWMTRSGMIERRSLCVGGAGRQADEAPDDSNHQDGGGGEGPGGRDIRLYAQEDFSGRGPGWVNVHDLGHPQGDRLTLSVYENPARFNCYQPLSEDAREGGIMSLSEPGY